MVGHSTPTWWFKKNSEFVAISSSGDAKTLLTTSASADAYYERPSETFTYIWMDLYEIKKKPVNAGVIIVHSWHCFYFLKYCDWGQ